MSTLVKLLLALIIQLLHNGEIPQNQTVSQAETTITGQYSLDELNPKYIITREELLAQTKEAATCI